MNDQVDNEMLEDEPMPDHEYPRAIGDTPVVSWKQVAERLNPQGVPIEAKQMIDQTFTVIRMKPYASQFKGVRDVVYWVVAVTDDGQMVNFTLGGQAVCDVLDVIQTMIDEYKDAYNHGDVGRMKELEQQGATSFFRFTLKWNEGGQAGGYYYFEQ